MFRLVALSCVLCGLHVGSLAAAQASPSDLVGEYDISETRNAPGESRLLSLELTAEPGRAAGGTANTANTEYFRYRARLRDGRQVENGTWWMAGDRSGDGYLMLRPDGARRHRQLAVYAVGETATSCALRTRPVQGSRWHTAPEQVFTRRGCRPGANVQVRADVAVSVMTTPARVQVQSQREAPRATVRTTRVREPAPPRAAVAQPARRNPPRQAAPPTTLTDREVLSAAQADLRRCIDPTVRTRITVRARIGANGRVLESVVTARSGQNVSPGALRCAERVVAGTPFRPGVRGITTPIAFEPS